MTKKIIAFRIGFLCLIAPLALSYVVPNPPPASANNQVRGQISMPSKRGVRLGDGYQARLSDLSEAGRRLQAQYHPDKYVIVSLHPLDFYARYAPTPNAVITQREKTFIPPVIAVTVGSTVSFLNEDSEDHNIHSKSGYPFNIGRRSPGDTYHQEIRRKGIIRTSCDIHSHMRGSIVSLSTPYFTKADADGNFSLSHIPDGRYRLEAFHMDARKITEEISVQGGQILTLNYAFR